MLGYLRTRETPEPKTLSKFKTALGERSKQHYVSAVVRICGYP